MIFVVTRRKETGDRSKFPIRPIRYLIDQMYEPRKARITTPQEKIA